MPSSPFPHPVSHASGWPRITDLPAVEREPFAKWVRYQTAPWIEGEPVQDFFYPWDYFTWRDSARKGHSYFWD